MTDKKERILQATEKLLAEHGFHGFSMQMVAKEAKVAAGTIYRYFEDKEDLLHQLHDYVLGQIAIKVTKDVSDEMPLEQRFRTVWLNIWNMAAEADSPLMNREQFVSLPRRADPAQRELEKKLFTKIGRMFEEGKSSGLFKQLDNEILSGLSLETSVSLARKHKRGIYQLTEEGREAAIAASWDAIIKH